MRRRAILTLAALLCGTAASLAPARGQTPIDGRIVRVVYNFAKGGNWGFHLAQMQDGRYCVRFGNPGRLNLGVIQRVADICFDKIPGTVDRSKESRSRAFDVREKGKQITVVSYQKGSIAAAGNDITLDIATCDRVEGEETEAHCSPNRYVVHINGTDCSAEVKLSAPSNRVSNITCEHYAAQ
jgi:hypothetical protein